MQYSQMIGAFSKLEDRETETGNLAHCVAVVQDSMSTTFTLALWDETRS